MSDERLRNPERSPPFSSAQRADGVDVDPPAAMESGPGLAGALLRHIAGSSKKTVAMLAYGVLKVMNQFNNSTFAL